MVALCTTRRRHRASGSNRALIYSQPFSAGRDDPRPEYRAFDLGANSVEWVHKCLDPDLKNFVHELSDGFLCLWTGRVVRYGG